MKKDALVYAKHKMARTSVKKMNPVMELVRGKSVDEASRILMFSKTKASDLLKKVLDSAVANATHNLGRDASKLYVSETFVNEGVTYKRFRIASRNRVSKIFKRTSHIIVGLSERNK